MVGDPSFETWLKHNLQEFLQNKYFNCRFGFYTIKLVHKTKNAKAFFLTRIKIIKLTKTLELCIINTVVFSFFAISKPTKLGARLVVGLWFLVPPTGVRIPSPEPIQYF
jgi:hypothetical protein